MTITTERHPFRFSLHPADAIDSRPTALCGRGTRISFNVAQARAAVTRFYCGRWDCGPCARYQSRQWIGKTQKNHEALWAVEIDGGNVETIRKRVTEQGGDYLALRCGSRCLILATVEVAGGRLLDSPDAIKRAMEPWLQRSSESWGKRKRVSKSKGFLPKADVPVTDLFEQDDEQTPKGQNGGGVMGQTGLRAEPNGEDHWTAMTLSENPGEVLAVLDELESNVHGEPGELELPDADDLVSSHLARRSVVWVDLSPQAVEVLKALAAKRPDPTGRLHRAF